MKTITMIAALLLAGCAGTQPYQVGSAGKAQTDCQTRLDDAARAADITLALLPGCEEDPNHKRRECKALTAAIVTNQTKQTYQKAAACLKARQYGDLTAEQARYRRDAANKVAERIGALADRLY